MNKKAKIVFFCMIFVAKGVFCQNFLKKVTTDNDFYSLIPESKTNRNINFKKHVYNISHKNSAWAVSYNSGFSLNPVSVSVINPDHYSKNFGFFCKTELQVEKTTKIPLRFRLGSLQQCDWMEGKRSAGIFPGIY